MRTKTFIITLILLSLFVSSCKKYEDGPLISLKSKNSRLTGEWKLVSYTYETTTNDVTTTISSFNGTTMEEFQNSYPYAHSLIINKDGTYTSKETKNYFTQGFSSNWSWFSGSKNKNQLYLGINDLYSIKKLTNEDLVLTKHFSWQTYDYNSMEIDGLTTESYIWIYEKQ